jgi:hypothetical protein
MAQEREAATSVVQSRLLKIIEATKRMKQADAIWLLDHACTKDMRLLADRIEQIAKTPDAA